MYLLNTQMDKNWGQVWMDLELSTFDWKHRTDHSSHMLISGVNNLKMFLTMDID